MRKKKNREKKSPPSSYDTMPWYYPTEQVDIIRKLKLDKGKIRKRKSKT
jgi:hypothetical protein